MNDSLLYDEWPVHQPDAPEAPIPGRHWYSGCDPDRPRVNPMTGICEGCGATACRECGRENCPEHPVRPFDPRGNANDAYQAFMSMGDREWLGASVSSMGGYLFEPEERKGYERALVERTEMST